ncbi:MAG: hypothetical protein A2142_05955, partial [candidate division Zixibacteria bacterium RBG_16_48_11]
MFKKFPKEFENNFPAKLESLKEILTFIADICKKTSLSTREAKGLQLVTEEICTNIIRHAYLFSPGNLTIKASIFSDHLYLTILDQGRPFDPTTLPEQSLEEQVETQRKGGLGLQLVKKLMDEVEYKYEDGQNQLKLIKKFPGAPKNIKAQPKRRSLRRKILLGATILWAGLVLVFYLILGKYIESTVTQRIFQNSTDWTNAMARNAVDPLLAGDDLGLSTLVANFIRGKPDVVYLYIVDTLNVIWAAWPEPSEVLSRFNPPAVQDIIDSARKMYHNPRFEGVYHFQAVIRDREAKIGSVHLSISPLTVQSEIDKN